MNEEQPLVLVVDDFEAGRELVAEYLSYRGYRVATAVDGAEALEKAAELSPDAVLMDLSLPVIDGWEATRRLRRDEATRDVKVIALTAHALDSERQRALEAGCDEVVTKPIVPRELEAIIRRLIDGEGPGADGAAEESA